jgi:hypothetical protein
MELFLVEPVPDPIKVHVNDVGSFLFEGVICNASCCGVIVSLD